jgi:NosR/NirI family transcriptional regulator, nitrous oxide reductase regulator
MRPNHPRTTCPPTPGNRWKLLFTFFFYFFLCAPGLAGELDKAAIEKRFGPPLQVQEKLSEIPAWPLTSELEPEAGPVAYVFESIDLAPIPGFEGTPMNFLVAIDRKGNFISVELLRQHEPVFLSGLGEAPLKEFVSQYADRNLQQQFLIALNADRNRIGPTAQVGGQTTLDGVSKATASIRIVNQSVLTAALLVARAKLGFADQGERPPAAKVKPDIDDSYSVGEMFKRGMIGRLYLSNAEVERLFVGTDNAETDEEGLRAPDDRFVELYIAYLNTPSIGRSLLGDEQYRMVMARNFDNRHLWWIGSTGRYPIIDEKFIPGGQSARLAMVQHGMFLELRDQGVETVDVPGIPNLETSLIFGVIAEGGVDPGRPLDLKLTLTRAKGSILPVVTHQSATLTYAPPGELFNFPPAPLPEWVLAWKQRWLDLSILAGALLLLSLALAKPRWLSVNPRRLKIFRTGFLLFTLFFIGWYAQGQLSIVQVTGAIKSLKAGQGLGSYLYDPISLVLIVFTLITFVIWGRGTFCGWLCPFGALQELIAKVVRLFRLPRLKIPLAVAKRLEWGRFLILAILLFAAWFAPRIGESLNEVEPFKTAITVGFDRSWPFVTYAIILLVASGLYYKLFCRFICPLGGVMSIGGLLRRFDWLPRRRECGKPCQTCKATCKYDAIEPGGEIRYDACFQCLDCVGIYHDEKRCAPLILYENKGKSMVQNDRGNKREDEA